MGGTACLFFFSQRFIYMLVPDGQPLRKLRMGGGGGVRHRASPTDTSNVTTKQKDNNERWMGRGETQQGGGKGDGRENKQIRDHSKQDIKLSIERHLRLDF